MPLEIFITTLVLLYEPEYPVWGNIKIVILLAYLRMSPSPTTSWKSAVEGGAYFPSSLSCLPPLSQPLNSPELEGWEGGDGKRGKAQEKP